MEDRAASTDRTMAPTQYQCRELIGAPSPRKFGPAPPNGRALLAEHVRPVP